MDSFFVDIFLLNVLFFTCSKHLFLNAFFNGNHFFYCFSFFSFFMLPIFFFYSGSSFMVGQKLFSKTE